MPRPWLDELSNIQTDRLDVVQPCREVGVNCVGVIQSSRFGVCSAVRSVYLWCGADSLSSVLSPSLLIAYLELFEKRNVVGDKHKSWICIIVEIGVTERT